MSNTKRMIVVIVLAAAAISAGFLLSGRRLGDTARVSQFGRYGGYSQAAYDGNVRRSDYLTLVDGTRLAYDLFLPTQDGIAADTPLPVLFQYTPYLRAMTIFDENGQNIIDPLMDLSFLQNTMLWVRHNVYDRGHLMDAIFNNPWLETMLKHGYAVVVVDRKGTGASFGAMDPSFETAALEVDELLDWIASQPWSNGEVGMFGNSWEAQIQLAAASTGNPHLKAIFPTSTSIDNYTAVIYPGGVFCRSFGELFSWSTSLLETLVTPVDSDPDGTLLAQAIAERSQATVGEKSADVFERYQFRDSVNPTGDNIWVGDFALYPMIERINRAGVPIYLTNGWLDIFTRDMFVLYANLTVPKRLTVRPLDHDGLESAGPDLDPGIEAHRWFDYWLKGIDNGIMDEPPIHYYVVGAPKAEAWRTAESWPLDFGDYQTLFFAGSVSGSAASAKGGRLAEAIPLDASASDGYTVDYTTTSGAQARWTAVLSSSRYADMRPNDERSLTYTTAPLEADLELTGHPLARLWLTTEAPDLDVFVYLEDVDGRGRSAYISEGVLRASHRAPGEAPFDNLGLPYYRHFESELQAIPAGEPFELVIDLLPTSHLFRAGNRIRITIAFADADNFDTPVLEPAPRVSILRNADHPSSVELPVAARNP